MNTLRLIIVLYTAGSILTSLPAAADEVYSKTEAANRHYKQGNYEKALALYEDALLLSPSENRLKMNRGSALYNTGDLDGAQKSYEDALSEKDRGTLAAAHYNLGNILFRKGEMLQQKGDQNAQSTYKQARDHYIHALDLKPTDFDSKWNLQLTHKRIKQLEQQDKDNKDKDNKDKDNKDKDNKDKDNKDKDNKDKDKQDQDKQDQDKQDKDKQDKDKQDKDKQDKDKQDKDKQDKDKQDKDKQDKDKQDKDKQDKDKQDKDKQDKDKQDQGVENEKKSPPAADSSSQDDMKKAEARRIIELYADDADSLNKPVKKKIGTSRQPEKDW